MEAGRRVVRCADRPIGRGIGKRNAEAMIGFVTRYRGQPNRNSPPPFVLRSVAGGDASRRALQSARTASSSGPSFDARCFASRLRMRAVALPVRSSQIFQASRFGLIIEEVKRVGRRPQTPMRDRHRPSGIDEAPACGIFAVPGPHRLSGVGRNGRRGRSPSGAVGSKPTFRPSVADSPAGPCSRTWRSEAAASCRRHICRGPPA